MTRGKQKIEAQRRNAERNHKPKGSQLEARAVVLKVSCSICKVHMIALMMEHLYIKQTVDKAQLANQNQLGDHYASRHPKEKPPSNSE
ncbi:hypothetical protein NMG60_11025868 [Bertholletia excelsa]